MEQAALNDIAREIIRENIYLTLATSFDDTPWATPLFYCTDDDYNFYYISLPNSVHSRHVAKNPTVSLAIFDSRQPVSQESNGVQDSGSVKQLSDEHLEEALQWYKTDYINLTPENLSAPAPYRMYKPVPEHYYVLDTDEHTDTRVEVFI